MVIKNASFVASNTQINKCPTPDKPEYAFIGRSNVGKSSLINAITNSKGLAKTSGKPGKTQLINHFIVNGEWYLVDLPGLGYAKASKTHRAKWQKMIYDYFLKRPNLLCTFILIDIRLEAQKIDLDLINWFGANALPFCLVFTKADKISAKARSENLSTYEKTLSEFWEELPEIFISSAAKKEGMEEILNFIETNNQKISGHF